MRLAMTERYSSEKADACRWMVANSGQLLGEMRKEYTRQMLRRNDPEVIPACLDFDTRLIVEMPLCLAWRAITLPDNFHLFSSANGGQLSFQGCDGNTYDVPHCYVLTSGGLVMCMTFAACHDLHLGYPDPRLNFPGARLKAYQVKAPDLITTLPRLEYAFLCGQIDDIYHQLGLKYRVDVSQVE